MIRPIKSLTRQALARLGIAITQNQSEIDYADRRTDELPLGWTVATKSRTRRKIGWDGIHVELEHKPR